MVVVPSGFVVRALDSGREKDDDFSMKRPPSFRRGWPSAFVALALPGLMLSCSEAGTVAGAPTDAQDAAPMPTTTLDAAADAGAPAVDASGAPALASLSLAPLTLTPAFSTDVHDYTIPCSAGGSALTVSATATAGATILVGTTEAPAAAVPSSFSTMLDEDDALVLVATDGVTSSPEYWVRCLPPDFPRITFTLHPDAGTPTPGFYLTGNGTTNTGESNFAMLLNGQGTPIWYERAPLGGVANVLLQAGSITFFSGPNSAYGMDPTAMDFIQTLAPWHVRTVQAVEGPTDGHELQVLPNGDVLLFTYPQLPGIDLTGLATYGPNSTIADCTIEEIDYSGALVWSWRATDHIDPVKESIIPLTNMINGVEVYDVFHLNAIDVEPATGNLLVSSRALSAAMYVNKATGKIVWKLGGTAYSKDGAQLITVVGDPEGAFSAQHDARFQPNGDISVFDDHSNLPGNARGVEYVLDLGASTASVVWSFTGPIASEATGSFRRYDDGSNVIDWGVSPLNPSNFTEVDNAGHDVLDVAFGNHDTTYRAVKLPIEAFDVETLRVTAGATP